MTVTQRLAERASRSAGRNGFNRRSFLVRTAVVGSAIAVAPRKFLLMPNTAYAAVTDTCGPDAGCDSGYTVFCCTVNGGANLCPATTFPAGWWRADGSTWCCGGPRYIVDCNARCSRCGCGAGETICADSCQNCQGRCNGGPTCDQRRVCGTRFRYGQCNQNVSCAGNVVCRVVSCTPPYLIPSLSCTADLATDDTTAEHGAPCLQQATWQDVLVPTRGDGAVVESPAVAAVRGASRSDVFVRGTDGNVYWSFQDGTGGWTGWRPLGQPPGVGFTGAPAASAWAGGQLDVFVRGGNNRLWQRHSGDAGRTWGPWFNPVPDGLLAADPAVVSWAPGRVDVFVLGFDGQVWQRFYENGWNDRWLPRGRPAAGISGRPAVASWDRGRIDLFVRGADNRLYQCFYQNGWSSWLRPPGTEAGTLASAPAAACWGPGQVAVFTQGTDGALWWANYHRNFWSGWARIGTRSADTFAAGPSATSRGCQQLEVVVRGANGFALRYGYTG